MSSKYNNLESWKPGVPQAVLPLLAAIVWIVSAFVLNIFAYSWLSTEPSRNALFAVMFGFIGALFIHHFGFLRIVDKNLGRIQAMAGGRSCVFAFMSWKSYLLVPVMIFLGVALRRSLLPRLYLAVLYTAVGMALFLSSVRYLRHALQAVRNNGSKQGGKTIGL